MIYLFTFLDVALARHNEAGAYSTMLGTVDSMARYLASPDHDSEVLIHSVQVTPEAKVVLLAGGYSMLR